MKIDELVAIVNELSADVLYLRNEVKFLRSQLPKKETAKPFTHSNTPLPLDASISSLIYCIGIPSHIKGYLYLREAIKLTYNNQELLGQMDEKLYPAISKKYNTTSSRVQRSIRHAIEVAWDQGNMETISVVFGRWATTLDRKPTKYDFITMCIDKLKSDSVSFN